jgi:hypothetical protein
LYKAQATDNCPDPATISRITKLTNELEMPRKKKMSPSTHRVGVCPERKKTGLLIGESSLSRDNSTPDPSANSTVAYLHYFCSFWPNNSNFPSQYFVQFGDSRRGKRSCVTNTRIARDQRKEPVENDGQYLGR